MQPTARMRFAALSACAALVLLIASCHPNNDDAPAQPPITSPVDSSTVAMDTAHWIYCGGSNYVYHNPTPGLFEFVSDGVKGYSEQPRVAGFLLTRYAYNLRNRTIKMAWKANDGGAFSDYVIAIADSTSVLYDPSTNTRNYTDLNYLSTRQPYNNSVVISNNTWYYTTIVIDGAGTYSLKTATGNYAADGGTTIEQRNGALAVTRGRISLRAGDPYAGASNYFVIHELSVR